MNARDSVRRGHTPRAVGVCLAAAFVVLVPRIALAADSGAPTIRAAIGSGGAVSSVKQYTPDGASSAFGGQLPVSLKITHTASGAAQTFAYHVENTFSQTQTVHYDDTAGQAHHTSVQLQLPLVAQLGVDVPKSMGAIDAAGAVVTEEPNGSRHVLWNMVLFTPLGSSAQDVSLTTAADGAPVAELRAQAIDPQNTAGLSSASQNATANFQQDDFWAGYASGGNDGLTKLAAGVSQMTDGLVQLFAGATQLHSGLASGLPGVAKLDAGATQLYNGSKQVHAGQGSLTAGLSRIHKGLDKSKNGLTGGLKAIHAGQKSLTAGLTQLAGGLSQLADPVTGLNAGVAGLQQLQAGDEAILAGLGSDSPGVTLIYGIDQVSAGLAAAKTGAQTAVGALQCAVDIQTQMVSGATLAQVQADPCMAAAGINIALPANVAGGPLLAITNGFVSPVIAGINDANPAVGLIAGLTALKAGADQVRAGLSHPVGAGGQADLGGVKEGLQAMDAGLTQLLDPSAGLPAAAAGAAALSTGASAALAGSQQLTAGSGKALVGSRKLLAGTGKALAGSKLLYAGSGSALAGTSALADGLAKLSAGQHLSATGLPAAVSGTAKLADGTGQALDGAKQIAAGLGQVQSGAIGPLAKQLTQASQNAHKQLAVLTAAGGLASQGPGGAGASYVLTQSAHPFALAAATSSASGSHTGRNVGIGVGGLLLLLVGLGSGLAVGRRHSTA